MFSTFGLSAEQVYGDMYTAWLRDTHEKNTAEVKRMYTTMIEKGFGDQLIQLRRQRLGANFISSLVTVFHHSTLVKLDLHGNMLRDVGCELLIHVLREMPQLAYLDIGANAIGCATAGMGGVGAGGSGAIISSSINGGGGGSLRSKGAGAASTGSPGVRGNSGTSGSGGGARTSSSYLNAMQDLGSAIAQHKRLAVLILGSEKEEAYMNQIDVTGATLVLEGSLLSRSLKRLDLSGNPFAMGSELSLDAVARRPEEGGGTTAAGGASMAGGAAATIRPSSAPPADADKSAAVGNGGGACAGRSTPRTPVQLLAQLVRASATLTHLTLRAVGLTDAGAAHLLEAVSTSRAILQLDIGSNCLSSRVADVAGRLLQQRTAAVRGGGLSFTLQSLILVDNDLWDNGAAAALEHRGGFGFRNAGGASKAPLSAVLSRGGQEAELSTSAVAFQTTPSVPLSSTSGYVKRTRALHDTVAGAAGASHLDCPSVAPHLQQPRHCDPTPGLVLLSALSHDHFITTLVLDSCVMDDTALYTLCRALMTNGMLKVLSLRHNIFTSDGVVQLGRALCRHPCLEKLFLCDNDIGDEGACALATALGQPDASLVELDISKIHLGDRGLIALGVALQTNASLRILHVSDNHFTHHGGASFAALLENNAFVTRCDLGATSVPHFIVLRMERTTARNRSKTENADADALKTELVRLHYQKYKLLEAYLELEALRENSAEVKRTTENLDLQTKQDQGDYVKRIRELEEHIENGKKQEVRYTEQKAKLEADLAKATHTHEEDMTYLAERLAVEVGQREKAETELRQLQLELTDWQENGAERETRKRDNLVAIKEDQEAWAAQRKEYRDRAAELQQVVSALESAAAAAGGSKKRKKSKK